MSVEAYSWNVVVNGRWNRAILTPDWIAKNIFLLESGEAVHVEVALAEFLPNRVTLHDVTVSVPSGRLVIEPRKQEYESLDNARGYASRVLDRLSETPVSAAGYNVRFRVADLPLESAKSLTPALDDQIAEAGYRIGDRELKWSLQNDTLRDGVVNLAIKIPADGPTELEFNFHRASNSCDELRAWLGVPIDEAREEVERLMVDVLRVSVRTGE